MHRIDHPTADEDANGVGRPGFTGGDPDAQIPPTVVTPAWLNAVQEELARACELAGPLNAGNNEQLRALLQSIQAQPSLLALNNTWTGRNLWAIASGFRDQLYLTSAFFDNEIVYGEEVAGVPTFKRREREIMLPASAWFSAEDLSGNAGWAHLRGTYGGVFAHGTGWAKVQAGTQELPAEFQVPNGGQIVQVRVGVKVQGGSTITVRAGFQTASEVNSDVTEAEALYEASASADDVLVFNYPADVPGNPASWDSLVHTGWLRARASGYATIKWTRLRFADPGPRNF